MEDHDCIGHKLQFAEDGAAVMFDHVPALQLVHVAMLEAPWMLEYVASTHDRQTLTVVAPDTLEYVPATQLIHCADVLAAVILEYVPSMQFRHTLTSVAPAMLEYVPVRQ